ncbi:hypothetical protein [Megalodesulfovibrio gigas]|uniref:Uncharacterized protein n=1 Tax=Megalodesulfovibrio gigas (strain ATCC 19364 / DSM 1382 / NCIMB 9332 / VKM B-1759) TaxID=1121448 RepID=T2GCD3_MEGG1|nr:hypothetical protein [Megalodesulfovibrio gigas]AGW13786.1 hypothetical protein DGI_2012 [Megalodesulfovibrio gigas DSM 1382 = ATCC 19364]
MPHQTSTSSTLLDRIEALSVPLIGVSDLAGIGRATGYRLLRQGLGTLATATAVEKAVALLESGTVCLLCRARGRGNRLVPRWRPEDSKRDTISQLQTRIQELERELEEARDIVASVLNLPQLMAHAYDLAQERDTWRARALAAEDELARYGEAVL